MITKRQRRLAAKAEFKKPVTNFEEVDLSVVKFIPKGMTRAYRNTRFTVMVYDKSPVTTGTAIRIMVQKHDNTPILNHWKEMQNIKNEIFGEEVTAIEYYPSKSQLIDDYNIYWMWIYENGVLPLLLSITIFLLAILAEIDAILTVFLELKITLAINPVS